MCLHDIEFARWQFHMIMRSCGGLGLHYDWDHALVKIVLLWCQKIFQDIFTSGCSSKSEPRPSLRRITKLLPHQSPNMVLTQSCVNLQMRCWVRAASTAKCSAKSKPHLLQGVMLKPEPCPEPLQDYLKAVSEVAIEARQKAIRATTEFMLQIRNNNLVMRNVSCLKSCRRAQYGSVLGQTDKLLEVRDFGG